MRKRITALIAVALTLGMSPVRANDTRPDIVGGQPAAITEVRWQVALVRSADPDNYTAQFCGGSILGPSWIVTAAHCLDTVSSPGDLAVLAGSTSLRGASPRTPVAQTVTHPGWDPVSQRNDVALLRLTTPIALNGTTTGPVNLPVAQDSNLWPAPGQTGLISGWGDDGMNFPDALNKAAVQVLAGPLDSVCGLYGGAYDPASMLCAGTAAGGIDSCQGDSGGPLVVLVQGSPVLAGITSWGTGCAETGYPGIYTRVTTYTSWIVNSTGMAGQLSVGATALDFGALQVGGSSVQTLTITNPGTAGQPITSVSIAGTHASQFVLASSTCPGYLSPSLSCAVTVAFQPTQKGQKSAVLTLPPADAHIDLFGDAKPPIPAAAAHLKAKARKRSVTLSWTSSPEATSYTVTVTGKNRQRKRIIRRTDVANTKAKLRASLIGKFNVCVVASNETGNSASACRAFRRR